MARNNNIFNIVLIAVVVYVGYIFMKGKVPGISAGQTTVPSSPTPQLLDSCAINPLQPNCIAKWIFNTINVPATLPPDPQTAHPSQVVPTGRSCEQAGYPPPCVPPATATRERGGVPLAVLEPWNPWAPFAPSLGMP